MNKNLIDAAIADRADEHWKQSGKLLEDSGHLDKAIDLYSTLLKKYPLNAYLYDRLMILYRRQKAYKKELALITIAIEKFTELLQPDKNAHSSKVARLSNSILNAVGLSDKKGHPLYIPQPLAKWEKRKKIVSSKISPKK